MTPNRKTKRAKRCNGTGNLKLRGNVWVARWTHHGVSYERTTKVHADITDSKGNNISRETALKVLEGFIEPFRLKDEGDVAAVLLKRMERGRQKCEEIERETCRLELKDVGAAFAASSRRNDISSRRLDLYKAVASDFAKFAGPTRTADSVTSKMTAEWAEKLWAENTAPSTFNVKIVCMRHVWDVLSPSIGFKENPWCGIKKKKHDKQTRRPPTKEEIDKIKLAAGDRYGGDLLMLIIIGENTGMRIGDCAMLTWGNVDFETNMIRVVTEKTGARVSVPMLPEFRKALGARKKLLMRQYADADAVGWDRYWNTLLSDSERDSDRNKVSEKYRNFVCPRMAEQYARCKPHLSIIIRRTVERAGIASCVKTERGIHRRPVISFHSFRHAFVSNLKMSGVSVQAAMQLVGHMSSEINEHYTHISEEFLTQEMKKVAAAKKSDG